MGKAKVGHIITRMIMGGAQKVLLDLLNGIDRNKYDLTLVTGLSVGPEGTLLDRARKSGIRIKIIPELVREVSLPKDVVALLKLFCFFRKNSFHIVHGHTSKAGFLTCLAGKLAKVPAIVYSPHGHIFARGAKVKGVSGNPFYLRAFYLLRRMGESFADEIIALSKADKEEQVKLGLAPPEKYKVIYNGVDFNEFKSLEAEEVKRIKQGMDLSTRYPVLGTVGRLTGEKGHSFLLKALREVKVKFPEVRLLIAGDGYLREELEEISDELGLRTNVLFLGLREDIASILSTIDIFVLPSLYEAFGLAIVEAMAMKKPVVATRVGSIPEIVDDGQTGILVPSKDPEALSKAIIKLAQGREMAKKMGEAGYRKASEKFGTKKMVQQVEGLYEGLLARKYRCE